MKTHGLSNTKLYRKHLSMIERCYKKYNKSYKDYGGRGIKVCDEWIGENGFLNFYKWAMENGYEGGLTIERKDTNGNYEPSNCCWVSNREQQRNKRNNVKFIRNGEVILETDLAKEIGIGESAIIDRIKRGKDVFAPKYVHEKLVMRDDGTIYESVRKAAQANSVGESSISRVCNGKRERTAGHSFRFLTKEEAETTLKELERE